MQTKKHGVFISYSSENKAEAVKIREYLEKNGLSCWFAPVKIRGRQDFSDVIPQAIEMSYTFLLLISESAQRSKWVQRELGEADERDVPIYTLFLEDCDLNRKFNFILKYNQHYHLSSDREAKLARLVEELKEDIAEAKQEEDRKNDTVISDPTPVEVFPSDEVKPSPKDKLAARKKAAGVAVVGVVAVILAVLLILGAMSTNEGEYVIWNPEYNIALTITPINKHYHAGEAVTPKGNDLASYSSKCIWKIEFDDKNIFTMSSDEITLGVEPGYNGIGLGGNYVADKWELVEAGDGLYYIRNVESGAFLEWYIEKNNWTTHTDITDDNRERFLIRLEQVS